MSGSFLLDLTLKSVFLKGMETCFYSFLSSHIAADVLKAIDALLSLKAVLKNIEMLMKMHTLPVRTFYLYLD